MLMNGKATVKTFVLTETTNHQHRWLLGQASMLYFLVCRGVRTSALSFPNHLVLLLQVGRITLDRNSGTAAAWLPVCHAVNSSQPATSCYISLPLHSSCLASSLGRWSTFSAPISLHQIQHAREENHKTIGFTSLTSRYASSPVGATWLSEPFKVLMPS